jgi:hypothetical protein
MQQHSRTSSRWRQQQARFLQGALFVLLASLAISACGGEPGGEEPNSGAEVGSGVDSLERDSVDRNAR